MTTTEPCPDFTHTRNGVVTPLYSDRQIVRAEDLTLDRTSRDAELARLRRYLHGWGVVAGLVPFLDGPKLALSAGYGVTPSGRELFLPDPIVIEGVLSKRVLACCGPGRPGCELVDEEAGDPDGGTAADGPGTVTAWLVARPSASLSDLRAGVPADCEHPATTLMPSRSCGGVALGLLCSLAAFHAPPTTDCAAVTRLLRGVDGGPPDPLDLPPAVLPGDDLLVLARLVVGNGALEVHLEARRRLVPTWVLQEWIVSCAPQLEAAQPGAPRPGWAVFGQHLLDLGFVTPQERRHGRPRLPRILLDPGLLGSLTEAGVVGPREFLDTASEELIALTGLDEDAVLRAKDRLSALTPFFGSQPY
jgi:hypothetical protein